MTTIYRRVAAGAVVGLLGLAGFVSVASANHSWGSYHWARTTSTFTVKLGNNLNSSWTPYLKTASTDWSVSNVLDTQVVSGAFRPNCGPIAGRVEVCNARYGNNGWLGIASIWVSGTHITQGTVKMNDTYFANSFYNKSSWRQMVLCQEVGHTFGLDHQDENFYNKNLGTCMDYTNDPARNDGAGTNLRPNAHDYDMLATIYAHLDTTTTLAQSTASSLTPSNGRKSQEDDGDDSPKGWGKEVERSKDGRSSLFEKDFGNGEKKLTHVYWAEPRQGNRE